MSRVSKGKVVCDVCGKGFATLGCYGEEKEKGKMWWLCFKCFNKADERSALEDEWPDARDYQHLKERRGNA